MDSFFLAAPISLSKVKAKKTHSIKTLKNSLSINLYPKRRHYCIKKKLLVENVAKISTRHARNFRRVTLCFK